MCQYLCKVILLQLEVEVLLNHLIVIEVMQELLQVFQLLHQQVVVEVVFGEIQHQHFL